MYQAIRAASVSLAELLREQLDADPVLSDDFVAGGGPMIVSLNTPQEMSEHDQRGISLWLYRVVRDDQRLNAPPERPTDRLIQVRPLPLRLHYLVTPISNFDPNDGPQTEQVLLGKVLQIFHDHAVLRGADLRDALTGADLRLHVRLETLALDEITRVWESLERPYQLCVSYEVSVLPIHSAREPDRVAPVEEVASEYSIVVESQTS